MVFLSHLLKQLLTKTNRIHVRSNPIKDSKDIVALVDRFLDDKLNYPMEWDDFTSWGNDNQQAELFRLRIEKFETLLAKQSMDEYCKKLIVERNLLAGMVGLDTR